MRRLQVGAVLAALGALIAAPWSLGAREAQDGLQGPQIASLSEAGEGLAITQSTPAGLAAFAASRGRGILLPVSDTDTAADRASVFVDLYGAAFGLMDRSHVRLARQPRRDSLGVEHVRFQQVHQGVPVAGGEFLVHLKGTRAMAANGRVLDRLPDDMTATVRPADALRVARQLLARNRAGAASTAQYTAPRLEVLNRAFLENRPGGGARLAWFVEAMGPALRQFIWIDAGTGGVLLHFSQLDAFKDRQIYNAFGTAAIPGTLVRTEGQAPTGNADVDSAYNLAGVTYDYYLNTFARDSFNGAGGALVATVNFDDGATCPNAFWNGAQMVYCTGFASADDGVAHELTHGVVQHEANLFYYVQSGALNESYADIFGETIDVVQNVTGADTPGVRWLVGEDLPVVGALRNMMDPTAFSDPGKMSDATYFGCDTNQDGGGVHTNSGVPNHAYALMVDGGTYNGHTVTGIGFPKAARIQYRALTTYLTSASGFLDNFNAVNQACSDLVGNTGITLADCSQVQNAMLAVEMNAQWGCAASGPLRTPSMCPAGGSPTYLSQEGFETGATGWTLPSTSATVWATQNIYVADGNLSAVGPDPDSVSDHSLESPAPGLLLPAGARLIFDHAFSFDAGFDGGVVEYSTDNGASWIDAGALMDAGTLYDNAIIDGSGNPLANRPAFTQFGTFGYQKTRLDLASLAGQTVRVRFRVGTDTIIGGNGWFVDNVRVYTCTIAAGAPVITVPPVPQAVLAGGTATFTVTATGDPTLRYQWLKNGVPMAGATSHELTVTNVQRVDYGYYSVIVGNDAGTAVSDGALLSVAFTGPPMVTHQPSSRTVTTGQTAQFAVDAIGSVPLSYQWEVSTNGGGTWAPLANNATYSGVTTKTLSVLAGIEQNNSLYRVTITGGGAVASTPALLIVLAANLIANGNFGSGMTGWSYFDNPGGSGQHNSAAGGVFEWNRPGGSSTQSVIFQATGRAVSSGTPLTAQFDLGNSGTSRKRVSVLLIDADFSDIAVCTFWLEPASPLRIYRMRAHATKPWANAAIYFYAATTGDAATTGGYHRLDNVSMNYDPAGSNLRTECVDPTSPLPPGGPDGPDLIVNGAFSSPLELPWGTFGQIGGAVQNGVFEFLKLPGTPAGVLLQPTTLGMASNQFLTAQLDLGNSSPVRKRVTVLVHDGDFSDLAACTFWLPPGLPLSTYQMRLRATKAWTNATLSIYPATTGLDQWIRLDNVSLKRTPSPDINGTECLEPAEVLVPASVGGAEGIRDVRGPAPSLGFGRRDAGPANGEWTSGVGERGARILRRRPLIELDAEAGATLAFSSLITGGAGVAEVQVSLDGLTWWTLARVSADDVWTDEAVDLGAFAGRRVWVQFAFTPPPGETAAWVVTDVRVIR
jgi:Zn-dependent metalloprotease